MTKKIEKQPHGRSEFLVCGARTRQSDTCKRPCASGKNRCYMHGGALGSGAPRGNRNALKHGNYTKESKERRSTINQMIKQMLTDAVQLFKN